MYAVLVFSPSNRLPSVGWSRRARPSRSGRGEATGAPRGRRPAPRHRGVRSITVTYGRFLEAVRVEYVDRSGRPVLGEKHGGGTACSRSEKIELDFPYEFVSGCYGPVHVGSSPVVRSVTFATSRRKEHGPFGDAGADGGVPFACPMEGGVVVGFAGRSSWHVDALDLHVAALRGETLCDVVQERGLAAYRSFVHGSAAGVRQQPLQGAAHHSKYKRPFEWCYK